MGKKTLRLFKTSRPVLALPEKPYWPALEETEIEASLLKELGEVLKSARTIEPKFKWSDIRKMKREERAKLIEEFYNNLPAEDRERHEKGKELKKYLAIGVNKVAKGLEKNHLACCLVHGQAKPKMLITHLIQLAKNRKIPVLVVNDLKTSMTEGLELGSLAVGFLKEATSNEKHKFYELCKQIISLAEPFNKDWKEPAYTSSDVKPKTVSVPTRKRPFDCSSLHLYRTSSDYRVFHPDEESISDQAGKMSHSKCESKKESTDDCPIPNKKLNYIETTILRVESNPKKVRKNKKKKKQQTNN